MKKVIGSMLIILSIFMFSGCDKLKNLINTNGIQSPSNDSGSSSTDPTPSGDDKANVISDAYTIKDYFPFKENVKYEYIGKGNEYAAYVASVDFIRDNKLQLRKNNGGTEVVNVLEYKNNQLKLVYSKEECYYREDLTSKPSNKDEVLLKEPLTKGTSWTLSDGRKRYISNTSAPITTLLGSYKALEVTTEENGLKSLDYYVLNNGLVETIYNSTNLEVKSILNKVTPDSELTQVVKLYYPNISNGKIYYSESELSFKTNDLTKLAFEKKFKEAPSKELGTLLGPDVKIKSLYLNGNTVYVDFTKDFVSEMNAGSGTEALILQCITNTLGDYYKVPKVYITIENSPYSSGHIVMKKGEAFTVNSKTTIQLKK